MKRRKRIDRQLACIGRIIWNASRQGPKVLGTLLLALLAWSGCGYRFSTGGNLPKDVRSIYLAPLVNRSRDVGIDKEMVSALRGEFRRRGLLRVVQQLEEADAVLSGVIRSLDTRVVAVNKEDEALQFETMLVVDMTLRRRSPDEVLWRARGSRLIGRHSGSRGAVVTTSSAFKVGTLNQEDLTAFTDIQLTETLRRQTRTRLIDQFSREIHQLIMERF